MYEMLLPFLCPDPLLASVQGHEYYREGSSSTSQSQKLPYIFPLSSKHHCIDRGRRQIKAQADMEESLQNLQPIPQVFIRCFVQIRELHRGLAWAYLQGTGGPPALGKWGGATRNSCLMQGRSSASLSPVWWPWYSIWEVETCLQDLLSLLRVSSWLNTIHPSHCSISLHA